MTEAEVKARQILRNPKAKMISHDLWSFNGVVYRIVDGKVLDLKAQVEFDDEMRRTGRYQYDDEKVEPEFEEALKRVRSRRV